jgi:hypothetical protein
VHSAVEYDDRNAAQLSDDEPAAMSWHRRDGKTRQVLIGKSNGTFESICQTTKPGTQYQRHLRPQFDLLSQKIGRQREVMA